MDVVVARCILERVVDSFDSGAVGISGAPVLHEAIEWPCCSDCGQSMDFVAQFPLRAPVELSASFDTAYVFCCPGEFDERNWLKCRTWEPGRGTNAVILQRAISSEESMEVDANRDDAGAPLLTAEFEIGTEPDRETMDAIEEGELDPPDDVDFDDLIWEDLKLGGTPSWFQDEEHPECPCCAGPMKYVALFPSRVEFGRPMTAAERKALIHRAISAPESAVPLPKRETHKLPYSGCGYVFLCEQECGAEGAVFLWQAG